MKDLNFFDPYIDKEFKISKQFILNIVILLSIASLIGYGIVNQMKINRLKSEIEEKKAIAENPATLKRVEEIKDQEDELKRFATEVDNIRKLDGYVEVTDVVNTSFLRSITSKMPEDMFLDSVNVSYKSVDLSGISQSKLSVAQFKKGLESLEPIDDIFVSNITKEDDHYLFSINILLEEVTIDGEDEDQEDQDNEAPNDK